jgi:hypothetical protein
MGKVRREDIVHWIQTGWKEVMVETITRTWNKVGINVQDVAIVKNDAIGLLHSSFS